MNPIDPNYLVGYGYTDQARRPLSSEQYAILLTALNTVVTIAITIHDVELFRSADEQFHTFAAEMYNNGYVETWNIDTQSYTVAEKPSTDTKG